MDSLPHLIHIIDNKGISIYHGVSDSSYGSIPNFCSLIIDACHAAAAVPCDLDQNDKMWTQFLRKSLPRAAEILAKRRTNIEDECYVLSALVAIVTLSAKETFQTIEELCIARNVILTGSSDFHFITPDEIRANSIVHGHVDSGVNFVTNHGKPASAFLDGKVVFFWPDLWETVLGGDKAIGHFVEYFHDNGSWYLGEITAFDKTTGMHSIRLEDQESKPKLPFNLVDVLISQLRFRIQWADCRHLDRLQKPSTSDVNLGNATERLSFTLADEGKFIMIWWPRYERYFYGRVTAYHTSTREHRIIYQDGDIKQYDMTTKIYEILHPPSSVYRGLSYSGHEAASAVAEWHAEELKSKVVSSSRGDLSGESRDSKPPPKFTESHIALALRRDDIVLHEFHTPGLDQISVRSDAFSYSSPQFQVVLINHFYRAGGFENIFSSMAQSKSRPIPILSIVYDLKLLAHLRHLIGKPAFQNFSWEIKEGSCFAMLNASDDQLKQLNSGVYQQFLALLKELISNNSTSSKNVGLSFELFNLQMGLKLLRCSQLQKRFWGLSIISDFIESIYPAITAYLRRKAGRDSDHGAARSALNERARADLRKEFPVDLLERWLLKNNPIDVIFVQSFHQDLSARSDVILIFLAVRRLLTPSHLSAVWSAATGGRHEAVVRVLHGLILRIIPVLEPDLRTHLYNLIHAVPFSEYSDQTLYLLKSFTITTLTAMRSNEIVPGNAVISSSQNAKSDGVVSNFSNETTWRTVDPATSSGHDEIHQSHHSSRQPSYVSSRRGQVISAPSRPWLGLGLLWSFVQDPELSFAKKAVVLEDHLVDLAIKLFVELLNEEFRHEKDVVIQKCIENIHGDVSVPVSLSILRRILMSYPVASKGWFARGNSKDLTITAVIESLSDGTAGNLVDLVLTELDSYNSAFEHHVNTLPDRQPAETLLNASSSKTEDSLNNKRIQHNGRLCLVPHLKGIQERLTFLKFIISVSHQVLTEEHIQQLWSILVSKAQTIKTTDVFMSWLDSLLTMESKPLSKFLEVFIRESSAYVAAYGNAETSSSGVSSAYSILMTSEKNDSNKESSQELTEHESAFGQNVLLAVLEKCMIPWSLSVKWNNLSRRAVASVCFKLFLSVNINSGALHSSQTDGKWHRSGKLNGLKLIWHLAADSSDSEVYTSAMHLLVEIHYKIPSGKLRAGDENLRNTFLDRCFRQLAELVRTRIFENDSGSSNIQSLLAKQDSIIEYDTTDSTAVLSNRILRYLNMLVLFFKRFDIEGIVASAASANALIIKNTIFIRIFGGASESFLTEITATPDETFATVREKVADFLQEQSSSFSFERKVKTGGFAQSTGYEKIGAEKDELTLHNLKFNHKGEVIVVRRISHAMSQSGQKPVLKTTELVKPEDLSIVKMKSEIGTPLEWLGFSASRCVSDVHLKSVGKEGAIPRSSSNSSLGVNSTHSIDLSATDKSSVSENASRFSMIAPTPLDTHPEMILNYTSDSKAHTISGDGLSALHDYLRTSIADKSVYFDLLLNMLDGFVAVEGKSMGRAGVEISNLVWKVIQYLPCHPALLKQLQLLGNMSVRSELEDDHAVIRGLFNAENPHRLLYTLQIIDSLTDFDSVENIRNKMMKDIHKWCCGFVSIGGVEYLLLVLRSQLSFIDAMPVKADNFGSAAANLKSLSSSIYLQPETICMIVALTIRLLHRHVLLDPVVMSLVFPFSALMSPGAVDIAEFTPCVPPGVLLALFDAANLLPVLINSLLKLSTMCYNKSCAPQESIIAATVEQGIAFVLTLSSSADDGVSILSGCSNWQRLLRSICIRNPIDKLRRVSCRRILDWSCRIIVASSFENRLDVQEMTKMTSIDSSDADFRVKSARYTCFCFILSSTLQCGHPSFYRDSSINAQRTPECYKYTEYYYSLIAALWVLQYSPRSFLSTLCGKSLKEDQLKPTQVNGQLLRRAPLVDTQALCLAFVEKVFTYKSTETFHSNKADETLVGVLRILVTLARTDPSAKRLLGNCSAIVSVNEKGIREAKIILLDSTQTDEHVDTCTDAARKVLTIDTKIPNSLSRDNQAVSLLSYLIHQCLGPPQNALTPMLMPAAAAPTPYPQVTPVTPVGGEHVNDVQHGTASFDLNNGHTAPTTSFVLEAQCETQQSVNLVYTLIYELCCDNKFNLCNLVENVPIEGVFSLDFDHAECSPQKPVEDSIAHRQKLDHANKVRYMWDYSPGILVKSPDQYVGLVNQNATCYMNALLQQLFQVQKFSSGLLAVEWEDLRNYMDSTCDSNDCESNIELIFQLQVLFGYLKLSQKRYYDAKPFCHVFKDYDGTPIRLNEQKDINEFASMLFERLEKNKKCAELLYASFGGKMVNQIISTESSYRSEREEAFFMITVEMKNKPTLEEALDLFVAGELLSEDNKIFDEKENRKVEAIKRCTIRSLPDTLIIHLKRFEFDLSTMERKKVNDKMTFPFELNMFPYTEEGIVTRERLLRARSETFDNQSADHGDTEDKAVEEIESVRQRTESIGDDESVISAYRRTSLNADTSIDASFMSDNIDPMMSADADGSIINEEDIIIEGFSPVKVNHNNDNNAIAGLPDTTPIMVGKDKTLRHLRRSSFVRDEYIYALQGVVAHAGGIDNGHYYSFIRDRESGQWREFNDRSVLPFSEQSIPKECFGGVDDDAPSNASSAQRMREHNAYLLVYERAKRSSVNSSTVKAGQIDSSRKSTSQKAFSPSKPNSPGSSRRSKGTQKIEFSKRVMQVVLKENMEFIKHRRLFDPSYFRFMWSMFTSDSAELLTDLISPALTQPGALWRIIPTASYAHPSARLILWLSSFCVDVLIHARAHQCVTLYFEKLEELVIKDKTGISAAALLNEVSQIPPVDGQLPLTMYRVFFMFLDRNTNIGHQQGQASHPTGLAAEVVALETFCHPWILQTCLMCPNESITCAFVRLLLVCMKVLLPTGYDGGYLIEASDATACIERANNEDSYYRNKYLSPVTRCMDALLKLIETFRIDRIFNKTGYMQITALLLNFASLGAEERNMLISIGAISRISCSVSSISQTNSSMEQVSHATGVVAMLIRSSSSCMTVNQDSTKMITERESSVAAAVGIEPKNPELESDEERLNKSPSEYMQVQIIGDLPNMLSNERHDGTLCTVTLQLLDSDIQAFLSNTYIEDAIFSSREATTAALIHVCSCNKDPEVTIQVLTGINSIMSQILESPRSVHVANPRAHIPTFRPFMRVVMSILKTILSPSFTFSNKVVVKGSHPEHISSSVCESDLDIEIKMHIFETTVGPLLSKCEYLSGHWKRYTVAAAEFTNEICNLLFVLALCGPTAHKCVLRAREWWTKTYHVIKRLALSR